MKKILALLLALVMVLSLAACASTPAEKPAENPTENPGENPTEKPAEGETEKPYDGTTLTYMASQDWIMDAEYDLAEMFEEETGIHVDFQIVPADQYTALLQTKLNSGECTDLFGNQSGRFDIVSQLDITKNAVPLSGESWVSRFDEFSAAELSAEGELYGVTLYDNTTDYYVVYNKAIFADLGLEIPTSYAEFTAVCDAIMAADIVPVYECVADTWHHVMWFCEVASYENNNPGMTDKLNNNEMTFADNQDFLNVITQINEMAEKGYWGEYYMSNQFTDKAMYMSSNEYAMTLGKPGTINEIVDYDPDAHTAEDFGLFVIPLNDNQAYNVHPCAPSKFIYSGSQNIEAAKLYLDFLCRQENLQYLVDNVARFENLPFEGLTTTYTDATLAFVDSCDERGVVLQDIIKYLNPQWMDVGTDISAMLIGDLTPEQVIANIDTRRAEQAAVAGDANW